MDTRIPQLHDRKEAGLALATRLGQYREKPQTLVLALPRGGVEVGFAVAMQLELPLDIFLTRKLGFPNNPEYAIGAITETGYTWLNPEFLASNQQTAAPFQEYLDQEIARQQQEIERQQTLYRQGKSLPLLNEYTVILVDDGVATGSTFMASIHSLHTHGIRHLVAAIPVGPAETINHMKPLVDHLEVLYEPDPFLTVGVYYRNFSQVGDEQVIHLLQTTRERFTYQASESHGNVGCYSEEDP